MYPATNNYFARNSKHEKNPRFNWAIDGYFFVQLHSQRNARKIVINSIPIQYIMLFLCKTTIISISMFSFSLFFWKLRAQFYIMRIVRLLCNCDLRLIACEFRMCAAFCVLKIYGFSFVKLILVYCLPEFHRKFLLPN